MNMFRSNAIRYLPKTPYIKPRYGKSNFEHSIVTVYYCDFDVNICSHPTSLLC